MADLPIPIPTDLIVRTYDPKLVKILFEGIPMTGYADGTFVMISVPEDFWEKKRGADGTIDRTAKNIFDVQVTLTLKGTSLSNSVLTQFHARDKQFGTGKFSVFIEDLNQGVPLLVAREGWIVKYPDTEKSDESSNKEWVIDTGPANYNPTGHIR